MKTVIIVLFIALNTFVQASGQIGQIEITRVSLMPNMPSPYLMRDWKNVAIRYDSFIFNLNASGQYLPLMHLKPGGINYPSLQPILLDSYVGITGAGSEAEAINIIPAVVGASLVGVNKTNQFGDDWVSKTKDFYNKANGQNVYLNGSSSVSGSDWWYDLMPNVFFYQLYSLYPNTQDFNGQFISVADRWLSSVYAMGASVTPWKIPQMNYRAFNLSTMTPNTTGIAEPEGAGTIGWLLYHAYLKTGDKKYLDGAQLAISYLASLNFNPAYEIQLPYGTFVAAKMNAELGTKYDIKKMINWSFDLSSERNWGTVVGKWGNGLTGIQDVSGLVGEIDNPATGYAFAMNGFEQAASLVPLVKYDKRFTRTIAKWTLNLANASRLLYAKYLPPSHQDSYLWDSVHDPNSVIAYEALKQKGLNDSSLYATGDAMRTGSGQTNLGIYGSSHVGYLGALVNSTDVDGILLLDVNKTDFFGQNAFPSYAVYNPYPTDKSITLSLGAETYDIYDAISETKIKTGATGSTLITVPADQAMLLVYLPQGSIPVATGGKLMLGNKVVDYHFGYDFAGKLRIQSFAATDTMVAFNQLMHIYSSVRNKKAPLTFNWYVNGTLTSSSQDSTLAWTAPAVSGQFKFVLNVTDGISSATDSLLVKVVAQLPVFPSILPFTMDSVWYYANSVATITCHARDKFALKYKWSIPAGSIISQTDSVLQWHVPGVDGLYKVTCSVKNADSLSASSNQLVLVKIRTQQKSNMVAYYPLDGDVKDYSGNGHDATSSGIQSVPDARGSAGMAYRFVTGTDIIDVPNGATLNFVNQITLSFWLKLDAVPAESYVLSHGSYQQRWKISVIPNKKIRWTIKTSSSTIDLDTSLPLQLNQYYHFTAVYTGYSMEWYVDGQLDSFLPCTGPMSVASTDITFGRQTPFVESYSLHGTLDEVRLYNLSLGPNEIAILKTLWNSVTGTRENANPDLVVYPNPSTGEITVLGISDPVLSVSILDMTGQQHKAGFNLGESGKLKVDFQRQGTGLMILRIETTVHVIYRKILTEVN